ncbi:hypothetical protein B0H16DRAFT_1546131 [Mycena metata]|uniref:Uncharacterized protein n=1 Tax=Mycena metata TaxID=1033252 RepID=A0AAD7IXP0_9AGAR|nr:hypothetical protein B0H16DRAFT_1546131 [Mycena metata]
MHFVAKNYLRLILSIATLTNAVAVYGIPISKTAPAVEERYAVFGWSVTQSIDDSAENEKRIFGYPHNKVDEPTE